MAMHITRLRTSVRDLRDWVRNQIVAEVPADLALCEFDCRKTLCSLNEWICCERRISRAAGESIPLVSQRDRYGHCVETEGELVGTI
jgi:hypothetical protein